MPSPTRILVVLIALLFGPLIALADELPAHANMIESLTPEQARKLVATFSGGVLNLDGLTTLDAETVKTLTAFEGGFTFRIEENSRSSRTTRFLWRPQWLGPQCQAAT
jgi:hypothetical protein